MLHNVRLVPFHLILLMSRLLMFHLLPANTAVPAGFAYVPEYGMGHWLSRTQ
jgi:hypothetical protein